ncbi:TetR/AcrR family transcriptional regulator [Actinacidiphila oryziradicis]|jgi:AcrR family transcriptional regulator|uniref:TetR/AcrR family transcriptional regulator n=1 Tax=Actinacidiphila oryziradicis TaxID=2571141 RepID=UPI0023F33744|nr:TetR/AcrR family transcriptional regulator [Actinacidiphila oryziradicis]MCW2874805.1 TetR family transcriptional regulator [Actinacidiphila oryziradicis]
MTATQGRPMRADARRNYERLLEKAHQEFFVHGTDASLEDIARHAGVGIGTLYRHFPDRYALMNAVFEKEVHALEAHADELIETAESPTRALVEWLRASARHSTTYRGLAAAIMASPEAKMPNCKGPMRRSGGKLLERAQQAGEVRKDAAIGDLLRLTNALVLAAEQTPDDPELFDRLLTLAVEGMRTRAPEGAPNG